MDEVSTRARDFLQALDAWRDHPERGTKDAMHEAEVELRTCLGMPVTGLHQLYYGY